MRKAALVGGIATGALLFTGSAAQAADADVEEAGLDAVQSAPEQLGGLTGALPLSSLKGVPLVGGLLGGLVPGQNGGQADQTDPKTDHEEADQAESSAAPAGSPVGDLLGDLGGGLPVPLPF
ncbi:hypothetical protein [Glycomyces arizonensis]|uniref:hypothetical protein n=1 Tax=Glycomyces arizonensis TaxID=256035 RepID=UPI00040C2A49|nr:hypothetical protein [Glycomyces arizonensis]